MSNEKIREEFEVWAESALGLSIRRNPAGGYQSFGVYSAWEAWQAYREEPAIELPKDIKSMAGPLMYADDVRESVAAAGISWAVKP
ncbi:hypothetical protein CFBP3846_03660 [Pseudomonas syringae pv. avii]|uniref:Uncharacterized protein n=1 Tax=Pseudomonas syringae pv. avii TaxID=663959 RepID=A0ABY1U9V4_PSESX|nr:hypothetical protein [Pseudomonas syringae]KWT12048.1 hypothetical protein AL046_14215 [Pseudomonas syringae pv. avii]SOS28067.1 hypothetical protein CFBP3846_03660 [Pseudomonas syringae pv. avii]